MNSYWKYVWQTVIGTVIGTLIVSIVQFISSLLWTKLPDDSIKTNHFYLLLVPIGIVLFVIIIHMIILMIKRIFVRESNYEKWVETIRYSTSKSNEPSPKQNAIEVAKQKGSLFLLNNWFIWVLSAVLSIVIVILILLYIPQMAFWCVDFFN